MNFIPLSSANALEELKEKSFNKTQIIFKHSPRCVISNMALSRLNKANEIADADYYMLNVLTDKPLSNTVAEDFKVHHESPQILIIKNGECTYTESHNGITMEEIIEQQ
ncbi:MAG: bacillithiol system redox-active protein YtxJ [Chitinophagales bacterium]|nr:bacillithiol system redox-active protein YtxJ [Chitinophagales bacterium]